MLLLNLLATLLAVATVALTVPVHTNQLTEHSVGSPQPNADLTNARGHGRHHSLKLKGSLHHHRQQKHKHVEVDEHPTVNDDNEESELHERALPGWNKLKNAFKAGSSSSGSSSSKPRNRLTKPAPGVQRTKKVDRKARVLMNDEFKGERHNSLPVGGSGGRRPPQRSATI